MTLPTDTVEVKGSKPFVPTMTLKGLAFMANPFFCGFFIIADMKDGLFIFVYSMVLFSSKKFTLKTKNFLTLSKIDNKIINL